MVVLVTGAASGFGRLAVIEAAKRGHTVYAGVRDLSRLEPFGDDRVRVVQLDVTVAEQREAAVKGILDEQGRIDALVNNAGSPLGGFLEDIDEDELRKLFDVNVFAVFELTKRVLPAMRAQRSGAIVMLSSMSGRMAAPGLAAYAASKFALEGLSEGWRHELAPFGIRVTLVEPGAYKTDILGRNRLLSRRAASPDSPYAAQFTKMEGLAAKMTARAGDPQDVARKVVDLCEAKAPRLRHPMGMSAWIRTFLLRYGPFWIFEQIFARTMR
jgi:NAD(P)-dependent dehydrogenase (short-subunit alcohol dehydrogenase family)